MTQVELFGFAPSTYVRTASVVCLEKGVPHTLSPVAFGEASHLALHPYAKMPAMRHGDVRLYETAAIAAYIDAAFDGPPLLPADPAGRAAVWQFVSAANAYMYEPFVADRIEPADAAGISMDERRNLDILERALADTYLVGPNPSLADLFVAPMLAFDAGTRPGGVDGFADWPHIVMWLNAMMARPSFQQSLPA